VSDVDFHRSVVPDAPAADDVQSAEAVTLTPDMHDVQAVSLSEVLDAQAAHGTSGDGRLRSTKINSGIFTLLMF
jgi:hypothetical protein